MAIVVLYRKVSMSSIAQIELFLKGQFGVSKVVNGGPKKKYLQSVSIAAPAVYHYY